MPKITAWQKSLMSKDTHSVTFIHPDTKKEYLLLNVPINHTHVMLELTFPFDGTYSIRGTSKEKHLTEEDILWEEQGWAWCRLIHSEKYAETVEPI